MASLWIAGLLLPRYHGIYIYIYIYSLTSNVCQFVCSLLRGVLDQTLCDKVL